MLHTFDQVKATDNTGLSTHNKCFILPWKAAFVSKMKFENAGCDFTVEKYSAMMDV